jgi:ubiquinone/menaquinone biosynthesis C-methylase UbiE
MIAKGMRAEMKTMIPEKEAAVTDRESKINRAYASSKNIYDDVLTQGTLWGKLYIRFFWDVDDFEVMRLVLDNIPANFAGRLLDVPVGTGVFTAEAYRALPKASITALDYSADMLARAKARFAESGIANVICERGDVGALPYGDAAFDMVLSANGFHAFPDKDRAFSETARVLKSGGIFCGCLYIRGRRRRTDFLVRRVLAAKGWFTPPFWTKDELIGILRRYYTEAAVQNLNAMAVFRCVK